MHVIAAVLLAYLAYTIALSVVIKLSMRQNSAPAIALAVIIPILASYAFTRALLSYSFGSPEPCPDGLHDAEEQVEATRDKLFGHRSSLWVTQLFEVRYKIYLERSVRRVRHHFLAKRAA